MIFGDMQLASSLYPQLAQRTATPTVRMTIPCQSISGARVSCAMLWLTSVSIGLYLRFLGICAAPLRERGDILPTLSLRLWLQPPGVLVGFDLLGGCALPGGHGFGPVHRGDQFLHSGFCLSTIDRVLFKGTGQPFADCLNGDAIGPLDVRWGGTVEVIATQDLCRGLLHLVEVADLRECVMEQTDSLGPGEGGSTVLHKDLVGGIRILGVVLALVVTESLTAMTRQIPLIIPLRCAEIAHQSLGVERINWHFLDIVMVKQHA